MKKQLLFLILFLLPMVAMADAVEIDGIYYNLISKAKQAEVTSKPNKYKGDIEIPDMVKYEGEEFSVTSIGNSAFYECFSLTSITIPNSVTSIGNDVFRFCSGLTSITIPNSVTSIGNCAFYGCSSLTSITIPNHLTIIESSVFEQCRRLKSITIPNSVTSIGNCAFMDCTSLVSVTIPNSVTSIGNYAFSGCSGLTSVTIPNSVTSIGQSAFQSCVGLITITIPNSVTRIGNWAFNSCTGLTTIVIPNSVTSIGDYAFTGCRSLISIILGSGISYIGSKAFADCIEMKDVTCLAEIFSPNFWSGYGLYTKIDTFEGSYIEYATLHVPQTSVNDYCQIEPWKNFGKIVAIDGETEEQKKCEKPAISYENGQLKFTCATEEVEFVSEITDADIKTYYDATVSLTATYNISVYATKVGYDKSDVVTATLCWIDATPAMNGIENTSVAEVQAMPVLIQSNGGVISINGAPEGTTISIFDIAGKQVGTAQAGAGTTNINTTLKNGEVGIVKIGEKAVKVIVK